MKTYILREGRGKSLERSRAEFQIQGFLMPKPTLPQVAFQEERMGAERRERNGRRGGDKERGRERMSIEQK